MKQRGSNNNSKTRMKRNAFLPYFFFVIAFVIICHQRFNRFRFSCDVVVDSFQILLVLFTASGRLVFVFGNIFFSSHRFIVCSRQFCRCERQYPVSQWRKILLSFLNIFNSIFFCFSFVCRRIEKAQIKCHRICEIVN